MARSKSDHSLDEEVDRRAVPALKTHRIVLGDDSENLFAAGVADMDFKAPPPVLTAMQERLDHGVFGYEAVPDGLLPALRGWLKARHGWEVDRTHILRAPNVLNILATAASLFTDRDDGVIVQPPVFFDFHDILEENGRRLVPNPLVLRDGRYEMDFDGLDRLARDPRVKMLYLCNPHNPVGRVWTRDELSRLGKICARNGVLVVSDEIHGDITFPGHRYTPFASLGPAFANNSVSCLSPAKSFNIAACCSAFTVISNARRRIAFQAENSRLTVNKNNAFASVAMEAAYRDGAPWLDDVMRYLAGNLSLVREVVARLPGVALVEPEGTFLLWFDFRGLKLDSEDLTAYLRRHAGWAVTRGRAFGQEGEGYARVNIACTRARLETAMTRLAVALEETAKDG
ncbi:MAG: putative C-S lyase [Rhodospirillaceae bacterium]|jgi:cysteine-S-conjugate beta-lyase|nr:putative C-S lyase [Rhodospirillaceae bacterium]